MKKKFIVLMLSLALIISGSSSVFGAANDTTNLIQEYRQFLMNKVKEDPVAIEYLKEFNKLSRSQQQEFVEFIYDVEIIKTAFDALENLNNDEIELMDGKVVVKNCCEITETTNDQMDQTFATSSSLIVATSTCSNDINILGLNSNFKTYVTYEKTSTKIENILDDGQAHTNWNPAVLISHQGVSSWKPSSGANVNARGSFRVGATGSLNFLSHTKYQDLLVYPDESGSCSLYTA